MATISEIKQKLCMIGDWGVGKTSLIRKFVYNQFDDKYLVTFGTKVSKKRIKYKVDKENIVDMNLIIWDIMGQKEFKRVQLNAYKSANGAFIICDVTRNDTLFNIYTWQSDLYEVTGEIPIVILANKADLRGQEKFSEDDLRKVANDINAPYFFTSAKTGDNVEDAFTNLGLKLIK